MSEQDKTNQTARLTSGIALAFGLWLIAAPWVLGYSDSVGFWNDLLVGIALVVVAALKTAQPVRFQKLGWLIVGLGIWLMVAPFLLQYGAGVYSINPPLWNDATVGVFVAVLGWLSAGMTSRSAAGPRER